MKIDDSGLVDMAVLWEEAADLEDAGKTAEALAHWRRGIAEQRRQNATKDLEAMFAKHYGPGEHPGTGSGQDVHGGNGEGGGESARESGVDLSSQESHALQLWTGGRYARLRAVGEDPKSYSQAERDEYRAFIAALDKLPSHTGVAWRTLALTDESDLRGVEGFLAPGKTFTVKGPVSATRAERAIGWGGQQAGGTRVFLEMRLAGGGARVPDDQTKFSEEREVIIRPNRRFSIEKVTRTGASAGYGKQIHVVLQEID